MRAPYILSGLMAVSGAGLSAPAAAATTNADALRFMTPPQARAWARQQIAPRADRSVAAADVQPPVLTAIDAPASVDVRFPDATFVTIKATDNLSGVNWGHLYARGPSGQFLTAFVGTSLPSRQYAGGMSLRGLTNFAEPGTYTVTDVYLYDVAGNMAYFDEAALVGLGRTTFEVRNRQGYDAKAPSLQSGKILTPQLSLSDTTPGSTRGRFAGVQVKVTDQGDTVTSGVAWVSGEFCLLDTSACFWTNADDMSNGAASSLRMGGELYADSALVPGDYYLRTMQITDYGGNYQYLMGAEFGGSTDFSLYFPSTKITLTQ
jgi:hypothetical protein